METTEATSLCLLIRAPLSLRFSFITQYIQGHSLVFASFFIHHVPCTICVISGSVPHRTVHALHAACASVPSQRCALQRGCVFYLITSSRPWQTSANRRDAKGWKRNASAITSKNGITEQQNLASRRDLSSLWSHVMRKEITFPNEILPLHRPRCMAPCSSRIQNPVSRPHIPGHE